MKDILFACDLDNTLLYSYKYKRNGDVCVEKNKGKKQSIMTSHTINLLKELNLKIRFIPVTTRSIEQYLRIQWPKGCMPEYAITTNGAILLHNEKIDTQWSIKHTSLFNEYRKEIYEQYIKYSLKKQCIRCRIVDNSYLFLYCKPDVSVEECTESCRKETNLVVQSHGQKIYFFPPGLNKGMAVKELCNKFIVNKVYVAGDSCIDIPMFQYADIAFIPKRINFNIVENERLKKQKTDGIFSDWLLNELYQIVNWGIN